MAKKALCIGINDYPGTDNDLAGCVNDAHDWADALTQRGYAVTTLLDSQATHDAMSQALTQLVTGAVPGDSVVITYSGHGTWVPDSSGDEPDGRDEALCPYDLGTTGPLLDDEIGEIFARRAAGVHVLLISDSCHSGSVTRGREDDLDPGLARARFMPLVSWMPADELPATSSVPATRKTKGLVQSGGDLLLAGCTDQQFSFDTSFKGRPNGAFTYYALKTLREAKPTNYNAWFNAIRAYLPSTRLPQNPQIFGSAKMRRARVLD